MKNLAILISIINGVIGVSHYSCAQEADSARVGLELPDSTRVRIVLAASYQGDSVLLRWAPALPGGWSLLNRTGYTVQRREVTDDTTGIRWETLSSQPIRPLPVEKWSKFAEDTVNTYPLIAAQAIHGKTFSQRPATSIADKADELTNRYSFTLLSADLSYETALYAGLGFTDRTVRPGKLYAYRIFAADSLRGYLPADTGMVALQTVTEPGLGGPAILKAEEGEHRVSLFWEKAAYQPAFTAYYIERSDDARTFRRLHEKPYLQMDNPALNQESPYFTYIDSLQVNYTPYWYRLVGIDAFGRLSTPGGAVKAMGRDKTPPQPPRHLKTTILSSGGVELTWEADEESDLAGFLIGRSAENSLSGFEPLTEEPLPKNVRRFVDHTPRTDAPNYYIVAATDTAKNAAVSMAAHVAFLDSIPPSPPTGLTATIDTLGVLTLAWKQSPERDVMGYIVSYANDSTHFFTSAVDQALRDTVFVDTLSLATLTEEIYYRVRAVDHNHNTSGESAILAVKKPDLIPPVAPQFTDFRVEEKQVKLVWVPSSSEDVVVHEIFRREWGQSVWEPVTTIPAGSPVVTFADTLFKSNTRYEYMIRAVDDAGLRSPESALLPVRTLRNLMAEGPATFTSMLMERKRVVVRWSLKSSTDARIVIYKATNGGAFETLASFDTKTAELEDSLVTAGNSYEYTCKLHYADGRSSAFYAIQRVAF